jgi:hypothetical protein
LRDELECSVADRRTPRWSTPRPPSAASQTATSKDRQPRHVNCFRGTPRAAASKEGSTHASEHDVREDQPAGISRNRRIVSTPHRPWRQETIRIANPIVGFRAPRTPRWSPRPYESGSRSAPLAPPPAFG